MTLDAETYSQAGAACSVRGPGWRVSRGTGGTAHLSGLPASWRRPGGIRRISAEVSETTTRPPASSTRTAPPDRVQDRLRDLIRRDWGGELPIGLAVVLETGTADVPYLIAAPTMRAPVSVAQTLNAYLAFRAVLRAVGRQNEQRPGSIRSVACPGMGTGTGEMPVGVCAKQMRAAWDEVEGGQPFRPTGVNDALVQHYRLLRDE